MRLELMYHITCRNPVSGPFHHSGVGRNPEVAGRFVAMISFLHTLVSRPRGDRPLAFLDKLAYIGVPPPTRGKAGLAGPAARAVCPARLKI